MLVKRGSAEKENASQIRDLKFQRRKSQKAGEILQAAKSAFRMTPLDCGQLGGWLYNPATVDVAKWAATAAKLRGEVTKPRQ